MECQKRKVIFGDFNIKIRATYLRYFSIVWVFKDACLQNKITAFVMFSHNLKIMPLIGIQVVAEVYEEKLQTVDQ